MGLYGVRRVWVGRHEYAGHRLGGEEGHGGHGHG